MGHKNLSEKSLLEELQTNILVHTGQKLTKKALTDRCIEFVARNFDNFLIDEIGSPKRIQEKIREILNHTTNSG